MKIASLGSDSTSHGVRGQSRVTFESNSTAFYGQISGLAEDKIGYPIREIASNAWDAARGDVDITLPTDLNPIFACRDRGPGLSDDFMQNRYTRMYHSDKRDDPDKIGGWGLGRFSPFAYLLSEEKTGFYMITSWHEGTRTDYIMDLAGDGQPTLKTMSSKPSDEPSGIKVQFAVQKKDMEAFALRAKEILWSFQPRPNVTPSLDFAEVVPIMEGSDWKLYGNGPGVPFSGPHVRIGCVMYPVDLTRDGIINDTKGFLTDNTNVLFEASINTVQPTLSREDLAYDQRTIRCLSEHIARYYEEYKKSLQDRLDGDTGYFAAARTMYRAFESINRSSIPALREAFKWKDISFPESIQSEDNVRFALLHEEWSRTSVKAFDGTAHIFPHTLANAQIVIEHNPSFSIGKLIAAGLEGRKVFWIRCKRMYREAVLERFGNPENVIYLDAYEAESQVIRPRTVRRRSLIILGQRHSYRTFTFETREIDLSQPQYYIRATKTTAGHANYVTKDDKPIYNAHDIIESMLSQLRLNGRGVGTIPVVPVSDPSSIGENWIDVIEYLKGLVKPTLTATQTSGWSSRSIHDLPSIAQWLRGVPSPPFQRLEGEIAEFFREMHEAAQIVSVTYRYSQGIPIVQAMRTLGEVIEEDGITDRKLVEYKEKARLLSAQYPLLDPICRHNVTVAGQLPNHFSDRRSREYERLLLLERGSDERPTTGKQPIRSRASV